MPVIGSVARDLHRQRTEKVPAFLHSEAERAGKASEREIRRRTPEGKRIDPNTGTVLGPSGRLRATVRRLPVTRTRTGYRTGAASNHRAASLVENGAPPHVIHARPGSALHWWVGPGDERFAASVAHPGFTGRHMFAEGINAALASEMIDANLRLQRAIR